MTPSGTINNFNTVSRTGGNQDQVVARVDQDITLRQRLLVRFSHWKVTDLPIDPLGSGVCADRCSEKYSTNAAVVAYDYNVSSCDDIRLQCQPQPFQVQPLADECRF